MSSMKSSKLNRKQAIDRLLTRGVTEVVNRKHLEAALKSGKKLRVKLGIDPTGPKVHLGNAVIIRKLRDFQRLGHKAVLIIGDSTALIGDPSDKLAKRPMLTPAQVKTNLKDYKTQLGRIVDLKKAEFHFNSEWLAKLKFADIAQLAETFTVQQMLARRNFRDRIESGKEISLRELLYPLMQGYDSVAIKADVEIGGFDQLFNVLAGRTIQQFYGQKPQDILTGEMLDGTDGRKMSKSWGNVVNIVDSANDMFAKVMAVKDGLIKKYFTLCTDRSLAEINRIMSAIAKKNMNPRDAKIILAREIVTLYHGAVAAKKAEAEFRKVYQREELPSKMKTVRVKADAVPLRDLIAVVGLAPSKSEAHRLIIQGGIKVDGIKVMNPQKSIDLAGVGVVLQAGKAKFARVVR